MAVVAVGSYNETKGQRGLAHFIEHLFFLGDFYQKLISNIYKHGGIINAFTSYRYTGYYIKISNQHLHLAIDSLLKLIQRNWSDLDPTLIEREKQVVIQENHKHLSIPESILFDELYSKLFAETNMQYSVGGIDNDIKHFTKSVVLKFIKKWYQPNNISFVVIGGKNSHPISTKKLKCSNLTHPQSGGFKEKFVLVGIRINGYPSLKERLCLDIISVVLGGNMASRLFIKLRQDNGYIYNVKSDYTDYANGLGSLTIFCGTQKNHLQNVSSIIVNEIKDIIDNCITKQELTYSINYIIGNFDLLKEDTRDICHFYSTQHSLYHNWDKIDSIIKLLKNIRHKDVLNTCRKYISLNNMKIGLSIN